MNDELLYQIALTCVSGIGPVQANLLLQHFETPSAIFKAKQSTLMAIDGIGEIKAQQIKSFTDFSSIEEEIKLIEKYQIQPLFIKDANYPTRFLHCYDPPTMLYYRGEAHLNASKIIAIVGTRHYTDYGKQITEQFIEEIKEEKITIVSGLALGIDSIAHRAAIRRELPTIGVMAHGHSLLYPSLNKSLATEMLENGGLLSEFRFKTPPDKHNFPTRNRLVAGLCDALLVIESGRKGGSMITAELANNYNKDVFAIPGAIHQPKSQGCNALIQQNKAVLFTDASHFLQHMGWIKQPVTSKKAVQPSLFLEFSPDEQTISQILTSTHPMHIDEINFKSGLTNSKVASTLLSLELKNIVISLPGKMYKLN